MKCIVCESEMKCVDDVNDVSTRIDWMECPVCGTKAEIIYTNTTHPCIEKVTFTKVKDKEVLHNSAKVFSDIAEISVDEATDVLLATMNAFKEPTTEIFGNTYEPDGVGICKTYYCQKCKNTRCLWQGKDKYAYCNDFE